MRSFRCRVVARVGLPALALCCAALALSGPAPAREQAKAAPVWVFVGTYTTGTKSEGVYRFALDPDTGKLTDKEVAAKTTDPSFLAVHPNHRFLYAVSEIAAFGGKKTGAVGAFALDPKTGHLTALNKQPSGGAGPCHLVVDRPGKHVLVANYGGGSASAIPIGTDGRLGEPTAVVRHKGSGPNKGRQEGPHAHSINLDGANRFAFVADLGLDKVLVYRFDAAKGTLTPNDPPAVATAPGAGPRHFAFHPDGKHAYVINELDSTITALSYDPERGVLTKVQTVSTLPKGYKGNTTTAEVQVHPSGKFLYGSNRGHDSIVTYRIDAKSGELTYVGHQKDGIKVPRNFGIDPSGTFLLVANQDSNSLVVFRIDPKTGELKPTGHRAEVPKPVCVKFVPKGS
jgi:6-phosphogluconolactonase